MAALQSQKAEHRPQPLWTTEAYPGVDGEFTPKYADPAKIIQELVFEAIDDEDTAVFKKLKDIEEKLYICQTSSNLQSNLSDKLDVESGLTQRLRAKKAWLLSYRETLLERWHELYHK